MSSRSVIRLTTSIGHSVQDGLRKWTAPLGLLVIVSGNTVGKKSSDKLNMRLYAKSSNKENQMDIAKTQWKVNQFETKQKLKRFLKKRSALRGDNVSSELKNHYDTEIANLRAILESNKCMILQNR